MNGDAGTIRDLGTVSLLQDRDLELCRRVGLGHGDRRSAVIGESHGRQPVDDRLIFSVRLLKHLDRLFHLDNIRHEHDRVGCGDVDFGAVLPEGLFRGDHGDDPGTCTRAEQRLQHP